MEEDKKTKQERDTQRKTKDLLRRARQSDYVRSLLADVEERPEEVSLLDFFFPNAVICLWCSVLVYLPCSSKFVEFNRREK